MPTNRELTDLKYILKKLLDTFYKLSAEELLKEVKMLKDNIKQIYKDELNTDDKIREQAKKLKIKSWHFKKIDTLKKEIKEKTEK